VPGEQLSHYKTGKKKLMQSVQQLEMFYNLAQSHFSFFLLGWGLGRGTTVTNEPTTSI